MANPPDQPDLFGGMVDRGEEFVRTHARSSDPDTSRDAAESVSDKVTLVQQRVLEIHGDYYDGLTDEELTDLYIQRHGPTGQSSIRSRRHDLLLKGRFEDTGTSRPLRSGRKGIVWRLTGSVKEKE